MIIPNKDGSWNETVFKCVGRKGAKTSRHTDTDTDTDTGRKGPPGKKLLLADVTKTRNGEWGMGNGEWGMGNGEWGMGNEEYGMGNGEWGMGMGNGE